MIGIRGKAKGLGCYLLAGAAAVALMAGTASAQTGSPPRVDISAQSLSGALNRVGRQTGTEIIFAPSAVRGRRVGTLSGDYTIEQALDRLLAGTGLRYRRTAQGAYVIEPSSGEAQAGAAAADNGSAQQDIVVTGTNIRGTRNDSAPRLVFDEEDIRRTGYSTTADFFRNLPQNFAGGPAGAAEDGWVGTGSNRFVNSSGATGINLRGLGNASTLVLVNGHRVAPATFGSFVDISSIPLGLVERIEILPDGSSAIYGSDAVAGVVNIRLRSGDAIESRLRYGMAEDGGDEFLASQSLGYDWGDGGASLGGQYRWQSRLRAEDRSFSAASPQPADLLPELRQRSLVAAARHDFGPVDFFADGFYSHNSLDRNIAPTTTLRQRFDSDTHGYSLAGGFGVEAFGDWRVESTGTYGRDIARFGRVSTPANPTDGPLVQRNAFTRWEIGAKADGSLIALPGGNVRLAFGLSRREDDFTQQIFTATLNRSARQNVTAFFGELLVPLFGPGNATPLLRRLELSAALRHDAYSTFGGTTNPRFGLLWEPARGLNFRAAYSTAFRAPNASEQFAATTTPNLIVFPLTAPNGIGTVPAFLFSGSLTPIGPERAESFTAGFTWEPVFASGARLTFNYYDIDYDGRIAAPPFVTSLLTRPDIYAPIILTFANDAEALAFRAERLAAGANFADLVGGGGAGVRYAAIVGTQNLARLRQSGFDLGVEYAGEIGPGRLSVRANATYIFRIDTQLGPGSLVTDVVDTLGNPADLRFRGDVTWEQGPVTANIAINHVGAYVNNATAVVVTPIDSWTTVDLSVQARLYRSLTLGLSVINLLDEGPPAVVAPSILNYGYDAANASPRGRFVALELVQRW